MTESLTNIKISAKITAQLQNTIGDETAKVAQGATYQPATALTSGTGANQADRIWGDDERTLADTVSEDIDVFDLAAVDIGGGAGRSALGQVQSWAEVAGILVIVDAVSEGTLLVGGNGTTAAWNSIFNGDDDAQIAVFPGGCFFLFAPTDPAYAVADTSNHLLRFTASGGAVTYSPYLLTRSA